MNILRKEVKENQVDKKRSIWILSGVITKANGSAQTVTWKQRLFSRGGMFMSAPDEEEDDSDEDAADVMAKIKSPACSTLLSDDEFAVLYLRFGLKSGRALTMQAIAEVLGKSKEYVKNTEHRALMKLREHYSD